MAGPESAGSSTSSPSTTSTVYQPDTEASRRSSSDRVPDPERGDIASRQKEQDDKEARRTATKSGRRKVSADEKGEKEKDDWVIHWDGPDDPGCPLNTPPWRKWYVSAHTIIHARLSDG